MKKKVFLPLLIIVSILCLCFGLVACNPSEQPPEKEVSHVVDKVDVTLDKSELSLKIGEEQTLVATVTADEGVTDKSIVWESKNETIATVDQSGKVTGKASGTALIAVSSNYTGRTAVCTVTVAETHEHIYGTTYDHDDSGHWLKVLCGCTDAPIEKENHQFNDFGVCEICNYVEPDEEADGLVYSLNADGQSYSVAAAGTSTALTYVNIPATYNDKPITAIKANAFKGKSGLEFILIPEGVTRIGEYAFYGCINARILLPSTLRQIGANAFNGCAKLNITELPSDVEEIPESAFEGCDGISSLKLPESVKIIGAYAFNNCANLNSVELPDGLLKIYASAFFNCPLLTDISIPNNVNEIGRNAFYNCGLKTVVLGDGITKIEEGVFTKCADLESVTFGDEITSIGKSAFSGCGKMKSITFPDSLTSIGEEAFKDCALLKELIIGASLSAIGESAFSGCASIDTIEVSENNPQYVGAGGCLIDKNSNKIINGFAKSVIPEDGTATSIGDYAFANIDGLVSITIPSVIEKVGNYAFKGCVNLETVTIDSGETIFGIDVFDSCSSLDNLVLPSGMDITQGMFKNCSGLKTLTLDGVESIGNSAFYRCTSLPRVTIPASVTFIADAAFSSCTNLAYAEVLATIDALPSQMFESCEKLGKVVLSKTIKTIPYNSFATEGKLSEVYFLGNYAEWSNVKLEAGYWSWETNIIGTDKVTVYCYSVTAPSEEEKSAHPHWWHYDADKTEIVVWPEE